MINIELRLWDFKMTDATLQLEDIKPYLFKSPLVSVATIEDDQPRVRPMSLIAHEEQLWLTSRAYEEKMKQIQANNKIEFCFLVRDEFNGLIRATGRAIIIEDLKTKEQASKSISFFKNYWESPNDPNFGLMRLEIDQLRILDSSNGKRYTFDWK